MIGLELVQELELELELELEQEQEQEQVRAPCHLNPSRNKEQRRLFQCQSERRNSRLSPR